MSRPRRFRQVPPPEQSNHHPWRFPPLAIAALHADATRVEDTDWVQIVEWYDELL